MKSLFFVLAAACLAWAAEAAEEKKIVCYFGSWAVYRPGAGKFAIEYIDPKLCTHLIYTFVGLSGVDIKVLDAWQDLPDNWGKDAFGRFNALRQLSPNTKTLIAIGGWNEGSTKYSQMAASPESRAKFVKNAVAFVKKHNFDGFDLDWEYPGQRGGVAADIQNFSALIKELREAFDKEGLLLTAAVGSAKFSASQSYNIPELSKYLHFINLMTYDLHGSWERFTGLNAPLYAGSSDTALSKELTVDACVKYWLAEGVDPAKLIVGVPSYGRTFTLEKPAYNHVGAPTTGPGTAGPFTREPGFLGYNELCDRHDWTHVYDLERRTPYAYSGNQWVGYDNVRSMKEKAEYIKKMGLGGAMIWSIETDDFRGKCGETYPLIKTLNHVLRNGPAVSETPVSTQLPTTTQASVSHSHSADSATQGSGSYTSSPNYVSETSSQPTFESHPDSQGLCKSSGNVKDPSNDSQFLTCVSQADGKFAVVVVPCPDGLYYDSNAGICNWRPAGH